MQGFDDSLLSVEALGFEDRWFRPDSERVLGEPGKNFCVEVRRAQSSIAGEVRWPGGGADFMSVLSGGRAPEHRAERAEKIPGVRFCNLHRDRRGMYFGILCEQYR